MLELIFYVYYLDYKNYQKNKPLSKDTVYLSNYLQQIRSGKIEDINNFGLQLFIVAIIIYDF